MAADLDSFSTPTLFEVSESVLTLGPYIRPLYVPIRLSGPAFTVRASPADNLPIHRALAGCPPGRVLVVSTEGDAAHAFFGEIMMEAALARGIAGLVIDGAVRDTRAMRDRFPVFSAGVAVRGTGKHDPGILGEPVNIGDVVIHPDDWIVGDDDGVVVVRGAAIEDVAEKAHARDRREAAIMEELRRGRTTVDLLDLGRLLTGGESRS
jgi:4-hydroxy-4-methyl-2-oxoglutarate aldolase